MPAEGAAARHSLEPLSRAYKSAPRGGIVLESQNGNGNADILFENNNGTPMIWEMNGTSIVTQATLTNPGASWLAVGTSDFNGDAMSDILWQNANGTPMVWQMNGTSVASTFTLPNPGNWVLKDDGPIPANQMDHGNSGAGTMHQSAPDGVTAPVLTGVGAGLLNNQHLVGTG